MFHALKAFFSTPSPEDVDLTKPSVKALAYLLRHNALWPEGFIYDYKFYQKCAMGLMKEYWQLPSVVFDDFAALVLGITRTQAFRLFVVRGLRGYEPEDIANDLDRLLINPNYLNGEL